MYVCWACMYVCILNYRPRGWAQFLTKNVQYLNMYKQKSSLFEHVLTQKTIFEHVLANNVIIGHVLTKKFNISDHSLIEKFVDECNQVFKNKKEKK